VDAVAVHAPNQAQTDALERRACELAASIHAATAELSQLLASFDTLGAWYETGVRSCAQWLSFAAGFNVHTGSELIRVGHALTQLPRVAEAFASGRLSFDKVRAITQVVTPADETIWVELALSVTASQLGRICREYRQALEANDPGVAERQLARRGVWAESTDDGMLRILALLPPEEGELVLRALEAVRVPLAPQDPEHPEAVPDPAYDRFAASRADALGRVCEQALESAAAEGGDAAPTHQVVVHVDVGLLTGEQAEGRCQLEGGMPLSVAAARRLGCDCEVVALTERDGLPIDAGRRRRVVSPRLRRALESRDRTCRFPGCPVGSRRADAHHLLHWALGGKTDLGNLVKLCKSHHRRLHDGIYRIRQRGRGELVFETAAGREIGVTGIAVEPGCEGGEGVRRRSQARGLAVGAATPRAEDGTRCDHDHVVSVIFDACELARARAGPP
jgi:hypothetical protein